MSSVRLVNLAVVPGVLCALATCVQSESGGATSMGADGAAGGASTTASASTSSSSGVGGDANGCTGPYCADPSNCGAPGHSCLGGDCSSGVCQPTMLAQNIDDMFHIALDQSTVYATRRLAAQAGQPCSDMPRVDSWAVSGGDEAPVLTCAAAPGLGDNVHAMAIFQGQIFWSTGEDPNDPAPGELYRAAVQTGVPVDLGGANVADQLGVDATGVYYSNRTGAFHVNLDGTGNTQLTDAFARGIAIDDTNVYLGEAPCDGDQCGDEPSIYSVPKTGGAKVALVTSTPDVSFMQVLNGYLYWAASTSDAPGAVYRVATVGGPVDTLFFTQGAAGVAGMVVDRRNVYTLEATVDNDCDVNRYDIDGGQRTNLVHQARYSWGVLGANDDAIAWGSAPPTLPTQNLYLLAK